MEPLHPVPDALEQPAILLALGGPLLLGGVDLLDQGVPLGSELSSLFQRQQLILQVGQVLDVLDGVMDLRELSDRHRLEVLQVSLVAQAVWDLDGFIGLLACSKELSERLPRLERLDGHLTELYPVQVVVDGVQVGLPPGPAHALADLAGVEALEIVALLGNFLASLGDVPTQPMVEQLLALCLVSRDEVALRSGLNGLARFTGLRLAIAPGGEILHLHVGDPGLSRLLDHTQWREPLYLGSSGESLELGQKKVTH